VSAYVVQVDRALAAGQGLFPASTGPGSVSGGEPAVPPAPSRSGLNVGVSGAGEDYRANWRGVSALDVQTNGGAADGRAENQRGKAGATGVRQTAQSQAAAIAPATGSPAGVKLLVSSMDERLAAMQREIETTKAQNRLLATRLRQIAAAYRSASAPMTGMGGRGSAPAGLGGFGGGGGLSSLGGLAGGPMSAMSQQSSPPGAGARTAGVTVNSVHGPLPPGKASEKGLQKDTILVNRVVSAAFPQIQEIGGYRQDSLHWHPDGLALDIMIPGSNTPAGKALGDQVLSFLMTNKSTLGVDHAIWRQAIHYDGGGGQLMEDRGSPTANHMDHVHVATKGGGYPRGGEVYRI
jgi:uncharacterized small protein (DUF1192 family)